MKNETENIASTHLGKKTEIKSTYDPTLLVAVPRRENRNQYNISSKKLPFEGYDVWHAYEFSCLTEHGVPVTRLLKLKYGCASSCIVESKSLKLYLNSFNMTKMGTTSIECLEICKKTIKNDLEKLLKTEVNLNFIDNDAQRSDIYYNFNNLITYIDENKLQIQNFKESPHLLKTEDTCKNKEYFLVFDSLRSNCRVTHQPDFGDVFIYYNSLKHIKEDSLFKYLCSFRSEFHFHEECCEMIFKRLYDLLSLGDQLFVSALYTRRGGIDICPTRWTKGFNQNFANDLLNTAIFARHGIKQ